MLAHIIILHRLHHCTTVEAFNCRFLALYCRFLALLCRVLFLFFLAPISQIAITASVVDLFIPRHTRGWNRFTWRCTVEGNHLRDFVCLGICPGSLVPQLLLQFGLVEEEEICCCSQRINRNTMLERWLRWHSVGMKMATVNMGMMMMMMSWMVLGAEAAVAPAPAVVSNSSVLLLGGLLAYNSTIGIAAQAAIELAVSDVNAAGLLGGRQLVLHLTNTNCSAFQGAASAMTLMESEVVAIIGPQSSVVSHFVSHMGTATKVPMVSFAATDPSLSEEQYPYFARTVAPDGIQMTAIAAVVDNYGWREVVAIYTDDDFGNNGVAALGDALQVIGTTISYKANMDPAITLDGITSILTDLTLLESRVYIVHVSPNIGRMLFTMAEQLQMVTTGYVWIVTEAMSFVMDDLTNDSTFLASLQGVIGTRSYIPSTPQLQGYITGWEKLHKNDKSLGATQMNNVYALYAYDAVWLVAHALQNFLAAGGNTTFVVPPVYPADAGGNSELAKLNVLADGLTLLNEIRAYNFTGITGDIQLNQYGDPVNKTFDVINMVGNGLRVVGYWSNATGILSSASVVNDASLAVSPSASNSSSNSSTNSTAIQTVTWPGGGTAVPRGWVVPKNGIPLTIGVPFKIGYKEFVGISTDSNNQTTYTGYCIDVFEKALALLPYAVAYEFVTFGNGSSTPSYDALVEQVTEKIFDGVVGDVTITTKRSTLVDFTQPYTTSGLAVVVPLKQGNSSYAWAFMRPFTPLMWITTGIFFFFTGLILWLLEHKKNKDFRGRPKKQVVTTLWFIFMTLFFSQREDVKSMLGRAVLSIWLFVVLIIISSYTASLTSILTVQQLQPTIGGISSLLTSNAPIGYQTGSFVRDYLIQLNIAENRLIPFNSIQDYAAALNKGSGHGGVSAIVDELPYVNLFLSTECSFTQAGSEFTKSGWGFAFPKGSQLAIDFSTAILKLSESGELQRIYDQWLSTSSCSSSTVTVASNQLGLGTFWGLFLITGSASLLCCIIYLIRMAFLHKKRVGSRIDNQPRDTSRGLASFARSVRSFIIFVEEGQTEPTKTPKRRRSRGKGNKENGKDVEDPAAVTSNSASKRSLDEQQPASCASCREGTTKFTNRQDSMLNYDSSANNSMTRDPERMEIAHDHEGVMSMQRSPDFANNGGHYNGEGSPVDRRD